MTAIVTLQVCLASLYFNFPEVPCFFSLILWNLVNQCEHSWGCWWLSDTNYLEFERCMIVSDERRGHFWNCRDIKHDSIYGDASDLGIPDGRHYRPTWNAVADHRPLMIVTRCLVTKHAKCKKHYTNIKHIGSTFVRFQRILWRFVPSERRRSWLDPFPLSKLPLIIEKDSGIVFHSFLPGFLLQSFWLIVAKDYSAF